MSSPWSGCARVRGLHAGRVLAARTMLIVACRRSGEAERQHEQRELGRADRTADPQETTPVWKSFSSSSAAGHLHSGGETLEVARRNLESYAAADAEAGDRIGATLRRWPPPWPSTACWDRCDSSEERASRGRHATILDAQSVPRRV